MIANNVALKTVITWEKIYDRILKRNLAKGNSPYRAEPEVNFSLGTCDYHRQINTTR